MFYLALVVLKLLALPLSLLPRPLFLPLGWLLGTALRAGDFRVRAARYNLELAFPAMEPKEREKLFRDSYRELGVLFLELLRFFYRFDDFLRRHCDITGAENLEAARKAGNGVLVMCSHVGNWEVLSAAGPLTGTPTLMVTKRLQPEWLNRVCEVTRSLLGVKMAFEPGTMPAIVRMLKKNGAVGMVMDQYAGAPVGVRVPFFGKPVGSQAALAHTAVRLKVPVVPAVAFRRKNGRYEIRFEPALKLEERPTRKEAVIANTALFVRHTEAWVREHPAQWLWIHRRWKGDLSPLPPHVEGEMLN